MSEEKVTCFGLSIGEEHISLNPKAVYEATQQIQVKMNGAGDNSSSSGIGVAIHKLRNQDDYPSWSFSVKLLLQCEKLWTAVEPAVVEGVSQVVESQVDIKAQLRISTLVHPLIFHHIQDSTSAREMWEKLKNTFTDAGLTRKVSLLNSLATLALDDCQNVEEYIQRKTSLAHSLRGIGFAITDEWLGILLLGGLPAQYKPMVMGLESSGIPITTDSIKAKLLQEVKVSSDEDIGNAFVSKQSKKNVRCFTCGGRGHYAKDCPSNENSDDEEEKKRALAARAF